MILEGPCRECGVNTVLDCGEFDPVEWGMTVEHWKTHWIICDACKAEIARKAQEQEAMERKESEREEEAIKKISQRIPELYYEEWDMEKGNNKLFDFVNQHSNSSLFICSTQSGMCKTRAVCAVALEEAYDERISLEFWTSSQLTRTLTGLYGTSVAEADAMMRRLCHIDLLIIDDLCKDKLTERASELLFDLIDGRFSNKRRTWITSNFGGQDLEERFGERGMYLRRRIKEGFAFWSPELQKEKGH